MICLEWDVYGEYLQSEGMKLNQDEQNMQSFKIEWL